MVKLATWRWLYVWDFTRAAAGIIVVGLVPFEKPFTQFSIHNKFYSWDGSWISFYLSTLPALSNVNELRMNRKAAINQLLAYDEVIMQNYGLIADAIINHFWHRRAELDLFLFTTFMRFQCFEVIETIWETNWKSSRSHWKCAIDRERRRMKRKTAERGNIRNLHPDSSIFTEQIWIYVKSIYSIYWKWRSK